MIKKLLFLLLPAFAMAQGYTSYFTGNTTNVTTTPEFGVCMMGGATEHDNAMRWLLQKANGGDVVVLRCSGSDGYNDYLYSELGVTVNSVETLVITSQAGATNPYVLDKVANAEMIWFAGGDQYNYVSYFKDNALEDLINAHINVKHAPIGGTSAGMAILGGKYFSAANGSVTSAEALADPYNQYVTLGADDFVNIPILSNVITDTHYDNPDRRGRQTVFLARFLQDSGLAVNGIACNEYVAVCIGTDGLAHVYGDYPNYQEFAYFIQKNCAGNPMVEACTPGTPLTWNEGGEALKVYKVPGTMTGVNYFDLTDWQHGTNLGGSWQNWSVVNGTFAAADGEAPACALNVRENLAEDISIAPNPFHDVIQVSSADAASVEVIDVTGKAILIDTEVSKHHTINSSGLSSGMYLIRLQTASGTITKKLIRN